MYANEQIVTILILFQFEFVVADKGEVDSTLEGIPATLPLERRFGQPKDDKEGQPNNQVKRSRVNELVA